MRAKTLCLDIGAKVIGVAISDAFGTVAFAREEIHWGGKSAVLEAALRRLLAEELSVQEVVVGLPRDPAPAMATAYDVVTALLTTLGLRVHPVDEHVSTAEAKNRAADLEEELGRPLEARRLDSLAAQIILERYLSL